MSNSIAPGSSADVNVRVTALTTNPNVPVTYKTIILKKNLVNGVNTLTSEMMSATNTKYVIKYDYTLGENITVPSGCILEFDGGSISGSVSLTGNKTSIISPLKKIFDNDIKLIGTWDIKQWECDWFGAVADGTITIANNGGSAASFTGTNNFDAIQHALYTAYKTNARKVHVSEGHYRVATPLYMGYDGYNNVQLIGSGNTRFREGSIACKGTVLFFDNEIGGIFVNSGRSIEISDLGIYGKNTSYYSYSTNNVSDDESTWFYKTIETSHGVYYSGIMIDATVLNSSFTPFETKYEMGTTNFSYSSSVKISNVSILGFYSAIDNQGYGARGNGDYLRVIDCWISYCVFGIRNLAPQARKLDVNYSHIGIVHTCFTNYKHSLAPAGYTVGNDEGKFTLTEFGQCYQIFDINGNPIHLDNCGGELIYRFGYFGYSGNVAPNTLIGGAYSFHQSETSDVGMVPLIETNAALNTCMILENVAVVCANSDGNMVVLPGVFRIGPISGTANKIIPIVYHENGRDIFIENIYDGMTPASIDGKNVTFNYRTQNMEEGMYIFNYMTFTVIKITSLTSTSFTGEVLTHIKNGNVTAAAGLGAAASYKKMEAPYANFSNKNTRIGFTPARPSSIHITAGFEFYDQTIKKVIYWSGTAWVDATGTPV